MAFLLDTISQSYYHRSMDHTPVIRDQITREVRQLISDFRAHHRVEPQYVELGYLLNSHKGHSVFANGECIEGLPVKIEHSTAMRSVSVNADNVLVADGRDDDTDEPYDRLPSWRKDCVESTTW